MTPKRLALATAALLAALPASAFAQAPGNDNYLQSVPFNQSGQAGQPPPNNEELEHSVDTTQATEQADLFNPPASGGPPETLACNGVPFAKTVWYDVYPDRNGTLRVLSVGTNFDPVIAIYRFPTSGPPVPDLNEATCTNARVGPTEELLVNVVRGRAYTIQVGGVNGGGGPLQGTFGFFPTRATRLRADTNLRARATPNGIQVTTMRVSAPRGARVSVRCTRRACRPQSIRASQGGTLTDPIGPVSPASAGAARKGGSARASRSEPQAQAARTLSVRNLRNRRLKAGSAIEIRVTRQNAIGAYFKYTVRRGNFRKITRCMNPGSTRPRRRCSG